MSGSGKEFGEIEDQNEPQRGPIFVIVVISTIEFIECFVLGMVLRSSWIEYKKSKRIYSFRGFIKSLAVMRKCFVISGATIIFFNTIYFVQMVLPIRYNDELCSLWLRITGRTSYSFSMAAVYLYLWTRQYLLHLSPVLRAEIPKWFLWVSKASLILTLLTFLLPVATDWSNGNWPYISTYIDGSCSIASVKAGVIQWYTAMMTFLSFFTQLFYMFLFFMTLRMQQQINKSAAGASTASKRVNRITARCFRFTLMTVLTDSITMASIMTTRATVPMFYSQLYAKTNLMINMVCMLFCFNKLPPLLDGLLIFITCGRYNPPAEEKSNKSSLQIRSKKIVSSSVKEEEKDEH